MSIATVVTRGYGTFGDVNKLPTLGYGIAAAVSAVNGVPHIVAGTIYTPGGVAGSVFTPGFAAATVQQGDH